MRNRHHILYTAMLLGLLLGIKDGYIALWKDTDPQPIQVFPYKASLLPPQDQQKLAAGIEIKDLDTLEQLLQDYLS